MIRAVIWDFGGVFTTSPFERFAEFEAERNLPKDFIRGINSTNPDTNAWAKFERNDVDIDQFDQLFLAESTAAGHPVPGKDIIALLAGSVRPRMVAALDIIREKYRVACITNNVKAGAGPGMDFDQKRAADVQDVMKRMELVVESSVVNMRKPDPKIYLYACEKLGVAPDEAVYLDDLGINLKPARALGMQTVKVAGVEDALRDLGAILGTDLLAATA